MIEWMSGTLLVAGAIFYAAGTLGLLRFPDVYSRLHALTKADNLGLGCVLLGLALQAETVAAALKLILIWPLAMAASAGVSYAIAKHANRLSIKPWQQGEP